eukprot:2786412-Prymnesium_polylepis.2
MAENLNREGLDLNNVTVWSGRPKRQKRPPPTTYWEEYVETDTWYQNKLVEDVPEEEMWAALEDDDVDDEGEEGDDEVDSQEEDDEFEASPQAMNPPSAPPPKDPPAPKPRKYTGPPKGSDAAKAQMERVRAAQWAKAGLKI